MLVGKSIQLVDYSSYVGKTFIITEDNLAPNNAFERPVRKGLRFNIKKIVDGDVFLKVMNTKEELEKLGMLEWDFERLIKRYKSEIKTFQKLINLWDKEPDRLS